MSANVNELKQQLKRHMKNEEYNEVLGIVAELAQMDCVDAEAMYDAAYSYFMCGEYERAAKWLNYTLDKDKDNIAARILLARLCILEDKIDSGLAIFDFILEHYEQALSNEENDEIYEILDYYGRSYADKVKNDFPYAAAFLNLAPRPEPKVSVAGEATTPPVAVKESKEFAVKSASPVSVASATPTSPSALDEMRQILTGSSRSVKEKVRLLNVFAGGYFCNNELKTAASFLNAALELDQGDAATLRNLAVLAHAMGRRDEAFAFAAKLPETDFLLLAELLR